MITRLPNAVFKPISYRHEAGTFEAPPLGWILHTQAGYGSLFKFFKGLSSPDRKFSTGWVGKDGKGEQYTELNMKSWANSKYGNGTYHSFETEGKIGEPLTQPQIETLTLWHHAMGTVDLLANHNGEHGIGIHSMLVATACPGSERAAQRGDILRLRAPLTKPPTVYYPIPVSRTERIKGHDSKVVHAPSFPYSPLHYFGLVNPDRYCHSGTFSATDRKYIRIFQKQLEIRGWPIDVDGIFGPKTAGIVTSYQREKGLRPIDGKVGTITWRAIWESKIT